jgi:hypothetical protein
MVEIVDIAGVCVIPCVIFCENKIRILWLLKMELKNMKDNLHCKSSIFDCFIRVSARSTAASAFSKVVTPFSGGHHLVKAVIFLVELVLCWPITSSIFHTISIRHIYHSIQSVSYQHRHNGPPYRSNRVPHLFCASHQLNPVYELAEIVTMAP